MLLEFFDEDSKYTVRFDFSEEKLYVFMSKVDRHGRNLCGWQGEYELCPYFSDDARNFIKRALNMKAFW